MADKILNARIRLKFDTLENWSSSSLKLYPGEVAFATIDAANGQGANVTSAPTQPTILYKVGTGTEGQESTYKTFNELPWGSAIAADVYSWAKAASLPIDTTGVPAGSYVSGLKWEGNKLVPVSTAFITDIAGNGSSAIPATTAAVKSYVDGEVQKAVSGGVEGLATEDYVDQAIDTLTKGAVKDAKDAADAAAALAGQKTTMAEVEAKGYITEAALEPYAKQADLNTANNKITALESADEDFEERIAKMETFWDTTADSDEVVDTLKEIQEYIASDKTGAAAMLESIQKNTQAIGTETSAREALAGRVDTLEKAGYATKTEVETAKGEAVAAAKAAADAAYDTKGSAEQALEDAQEYVDGKLAELKTGVETVTATTGGGLKVDNADSANPKIAIDDTLTFVLDCGGAND